MRTEIANNINEFLRIIHKTENFENNWYRGQRFSEYQLEPSLFRDKEEVITGDGYIQFRSYKFKDEEGALKTFKKEYSKLNDTKGFDEIHFLYLMQHHDIRTRLLDFSLNPLIALYFSVEAKNKVDKDEEDNYFKYKSQMYDFNKESSAVFAINPSIVNKYSINTEKIFDLSNYKYSSLKNINFPICIKPRNKNLDKRLISQNGVFVYFGKEVHPLDYYSIQEQNILKIIIPNSKREKIKRELKSKFNIYHSTIYPDMKGITLEVNETLNKKYK
ncbi:FRG domain-containing protein [Empedobacter falsenii]|uniref:FRG domain-containing protein n=1 Tax=Empedobacter falsenii TaxID=343874 RepID=UPI002577922B|nr:FRG domain-containing protein [Empedobacter falsenii]MDM1063303.1 FRG domain-containing protein [Empedobacter falsenii]